ncbi:hypothetical protein CRE_24333 [Caenorhabditis remanei]|uniref:CUT domain-containing protein n=1 Tax=Caenorhabditis remanei TaxID=31234 RepID=E3NS51_CAERE|nr:hypothetical protein CRE_24333 [Caenorhabditis remanei]
MFFSSFYSFSPSHYINFHFFRDDSFKKIDDQQTADYTLTELTTVQYPFFTHGIHPKRQESITCSERKMLIEEKKFEMRRQMTYGSGHRSNSKTLLNVNASSNVHEIETNRFQRIMDYESEKWAMATGENMNQGISESKLGEYEKVKIGENLTIFSEPKESTSVQHQPKSVQSCIDNFSSLPLLNASSPSPMTVEQAITLLTQPIPANINVNTTEIIKEIKEWLGSSSNTNKFFASNILNIKEKNLTNIFAQKRDFNSLRNTKETFIKMYNWLEMSEDMRTEMLKMNLYEYESPLQDENDTPKKIFRQNPATMTAERIRELMNNPVTYMSTKKVTSDIKMWLARTQTTRKWFATNIMGRAKRTLVINLNYPKEWEELTRGKEIYVRLYNWMRMSEEERQDIMRFYGAENVEEQKSEDEDSKSLDDILRELRRQFSECNKQ